MAKKFPYKGALQGISVDNGLWPAKGPYITETYVFDLTSTIDFSFSLGGVEEEKQIGIYQTVFIDNSLNIYPLSLLCNTEYFVQIPAQSQALLPLYAGENPTFRLRTTSFSVVTVSLQFLNIMVPPLVWKAV